MYVQSARTARYVATRLIIATAATATVCTYSACLTPTSGPTPTRLQTPVLRTTAAIVDTASIAASPTTIGIADSDLYGMSQADIDTTLDTLQSIGVQDIRIFVPWAFVEPAQGTYDWSYLDAVVNAAAARNMGVLAEVSATPAWDAPSGSLPGAGTPNPTDYAAFLTQVATRYGNDISSYEVWNEPNYVASSDPIDAAAYTALLKAAYPAIKAVDPNATVIAGAVGSTISFGSVTLDPVTFVQQMLADGASGYFDALSFHPYQETTEFSQGGTLANSPINQLNAIEQLLVADGLASDKVWITEYGLPTSDVSQQTQATYIQDLIDTWQSISYAGPIFIYTAQDATSTDPTGAFGIYEADWTPKLAVAVIQQEIAKLTAGSPISGIVQQIVSTPVDVIVQFVTAVAQAAKSVGAAIQTFVQEAQAVVQQITTTITQAITNVLARFGLPSGATATATAVQPQATAAVTVPTAHVTTTSAPTTSAPATSAPATSAPATSAPATSAPATPKVEPLTSASSTSTRATATATPTAPAAAISTPTTPEATPAAAPSISVPPGSSASASSASASSASASVPPTDNSKDALRTKNPPRLRFERPTKETTAVKRNSAVAPQTG